MCRQTPTEKQNSRLLDEIHELFQNIFRPIVCHSMTTCHGAKYKLVYHYQFWPHYCHVNFLALQNIQTATFLRQITLRVE